ncbi:riboflavin kinase/FMN adenylyltransferase [Sediminihabitans luteus]|uniref:Riboflavin biosynthesis protein n=1 Tax=Sediminihabitans luteus TaxID=1138585 RepID=A0A2M9CCF1_9CELL|nr:bifunctional riboflavin kinase/FAD synthetase [Sediminihabitans luteus]PJJ69019.1 riboflavin kinase/FMN adenylyltransferase [Sediminihabitans luteus]GII99405.1 riboflavin biosynthesis protein [Sediminihabitans luteus]
MHVWNGLDEVPEDFGPSVVTIGNFDGVHRGHAAVLRRIVDLAHGSDARAVAVTFDPHPLQVHQPGSAPELITGLADRTELLAGTGLDAVLVLEYTLDLARQTPEQFVVECLARGLRARTVVVGHDVRFGRDNSGTMETMVALGREHGFDVVPVDDVGQAPGADGPGADRWSSTLVRELLAAGRVDEAAAVLGRDHRVRGTVVHGDARGRELGFPTANLGDVVGMVPADGVYAGRLVRPGRLARGEADAVLPAAVSIGTNPTFDGDERRVEAYVLDRTDLDLYDEEVVLELVQRLRPTVRFDGIDPLVAQMHADVALARAVLGRAGNA